MKTGLFLAALVPLAAAQPHRNHHQHLHAKRQEATVVNTITATAPNVVIYVNQDGQPISTSIAGGAAVGAAPATQVVPAPAPAAPTPVAHHHKHKNHAAAAAPAAPAAAPAPVHHHKNHGSADQPGSASGANSPLGIAYSPYNADNSCKTQDQVNSDFDKMSGYGMVRAYGTDCNQIETIGNAAKAHGMKVFAGVFDLSDIAGDTQIIADYFKNDWSQLHTVNIGNELVNDGLASPAEVIAAIGIAKPILAAAGFTGPVVTVDTFNAIIANPELCQASDYAAANAHPFYDPSCSASEAGSWVKTTAQQVQQACNKAVVITETGWPNGGYANGAAVPGFPEQAQALSGIKSNFASGGAILFSAFDNLWQTNTAGTFGTEQFWGIFPGQ